MAKKVIDYKVEVVPIGSLSAIDLLSEGMVAKYKERIDGVEAYRIRVWPDSLNRPYHFHPERIEALKVGNRIGIAWGADADWYDHADIDEALAEYLDLA